jgi:hypothetical protein
MPVPDALPPETRSAERLPAEAEGSLVPKPSPSPTTGPAGHGTKVSTMSRRLSSIACSTGKVPRTGRRLE